MKNFISIVFALAFSFITSSIFSQSQKGELVAGINLGYSITGALVGSLGDDIGVDETNINVSKIPPLYATVDYGLSDRFSLGLYGGFERFTTEVSNYSYTNANGETITEDAKGKVNRVALGLRPLFHYGKNPNLDMYSGLRVGFISWSGTTDSTDPNLDLATSFGAGRPTVSIIAFGMRYYFNEMIGAGFELATGAPHIASVSLNAKFGGNRQASVSSRGSSRDTQSSRSKSSREKKRR